MNKIIFKPIGLIKSHFKKPKDALSCCEKGLKDKTTDGSLVLDIKPYVSGFDRPKKSKDAVWYKWFK